MNDESKKKEFCCLCTEDRTYRNCPFPEVIVTRKVKGFKDEPEKELKECPYQCYIGSGYLSLNQFTRVEFEQMIRNYTLCTHPNMVGWPSGLRRCPGKAVGVKCPLSSNLSPAANIEGKPNKMFSNVIETIKSWFSGLKDKSKIVTPKVETNLNIEKDPTLPCKNCLIITSCTRMCDKLEMDEDKLFDIVERYKCCPDCGGTSMYDGPSGGLSTNIMCCTCEHWFNITPFSIERINMK